MENLTNQAAQATAGSDAASVAALSERRLLTKAEVAACLGCCERSLERMVKEGRFPPPRRYGRAVVWFSSTVDQFLWADEEQQLAWRPASSCLAISTNAGQDEVERVCESLRTTSQDVTTEQCESATAPKPKKEKKRRKPVEYVPGASLFNFQPGQLPGVDWIK